jgi:hypothetical protein
MAAPTAPARSDLIVGIGKVYRDDGTTQFVTYDETEFSIQLKEKLSDVIIGGQTIDKRWIEYTAELTFNPDGRKTAAALAQFWNNYATFSPGQSIYTATDRTTIATGSDGAVHTLAATAITGMPSLRLHPEKGAIGSATITGIIGSGKNWSEASSFYDLGSGGTFTDATFTPSDVLRQQYSAAFAGVSGMTDFQAQDGFQVDFRLGTAPTPVGGITRDMKFKSLEVMVRCIPAKPNTANILAALYATPATGRLTGASNYATSASLVITGSDGTTTVTIPKCALVTGGFNFSGEKLRTGEIAFYACRPTTGGSIATALYTIA